MVTEQKLKKINNWNSDLACDNYLIYFSFDEIFLS